MKKYLFALSMAAFIVAACAKESQNDEFAPASSEGIVYTLSVKAPLTKASLDEKTGAFQWSANDQIAVFDNEQNKYQIFTTAGPGSGSGSNATFTFVATDGLSHDFTGSKAYYPVSRLNSAQTEISTPIAISSAAEVPMVANNDNGSLEFDYEAAVVKLTIENVPSFSMSVEFQNSSRSYAAEVSHSANEDMTFYFVVGESTSRASSIILYDSADNEIIHKDFDLNGDITNGALIPLKTNVGYPVLVENNTAWGGLDIYCYNTNETWANASFEATSATVKAITIGSKSYAYVMVPDNDTYSFVFRKPNQYYPRVEHRGVAVNSEVYLTVDTNEGARLSSDNTPRLVIFNQDKIGPVYIHYWGTGITGTTFDQWDPRKMISFDSGDMKMESLCTGLIYTGDNLNSGEWYFYYDVPDLVINNKFSFILHQGDYWKENKNDYGTQFDDVTAAKDMKYGWWNHDVGSGVWKAGAWAM